MHLKHLRGRTQMGVVIPAVIFSSTGPGICCWIWEVISICKYIYIFTFKSIYIFISVSFTFVYFEVSWIETSPKSLLHDRSDRFPESAVDAFRSNAQHTILSNQGPKQHSLDSLILLTANLQSHIHNIFLSWEPWLHPRARQYWTIPSCSFLYLIMGFLAWRSHNNLATKLLRKDLNECYTKTFLVTSGWMFTC